eukprot:2731031-Amphidinium_carterae.1
MKAQLTLPPNTYAVIPVFESFELDLYKYSVEGATFSTGDLNHKPSDYEAGVIPLDHVICTKLSTVLDQ